MKKWTAKYQQFYRETCLIMIEAENQLEAEKKASALAKKKHGINPEEDTAEGQPYEDWTPGPDPEQLNLLSLTRWSLPVKGEKKGGKIP